MVTAESDKSVVLPSSIDKGENGILLLGGRENLEGHHSEIILYLHKAQYLNKYVKQDRARNKKKDVLFHF